MEFLQTLRWFMLKNWDKLLFGIGLLVLIYSYGLATIQFRIFPYTLLKEAKVAALDWGANWATYTRMEPVKFLRPAVHQGNGLVRNISGRTQPGVTLITGLRNNHVALWLLDSDGSVIHEWQADFTRLWPNPTHIEGYPYPTHNEWDTHIHGALLFPNGDVIFNFEYLGMIRLDKCGKVVWRLPYMTHHSLYLAEDGTIWATGRKFHRKNDKFPGMIPNFWEPTAIQVSGDGKILREISILQIIYRNGPEILRFSALFTGDWDHTNDVEVFETGNGGSSPLFKPGDLLVSLHDLHLVFVFDPATSRIKWMSSGPWLHQHDPDFLPDGTISVFDNRNLWGHSEDEPMGGLNPQFSGSRILKINPVDNRYQVIYEGTPDNPFYTNWMGKHQYLPNGNILITQSEAGRAFEIDGNGEIVWEYINRYSKDQIAIIEQADRYPASYGTFTQKGCES
jgi:hypothetical protein